MTKTDLEKKFKFLIVKEIYYQIFHKPLIIVHQRADRLQTTVTENYPIWSHGPRPFLTQWNYEPCCVGPTKKDGSWWRFLIKRGPLEKEMANHLSVLALRTPWTVWKGKKSRTLKELSWSVGAQYATGDQWRNNSRKNEEMEPKQKHLPVVDVTVDGSKVQCYKKQYCIGTWNISPWIKANWKWSTRRYQSEDRQFRNQWTEIDWNGWI